MELIISIHAPAKGATTAFDGARGKALISIHAPAKGATQAKAEKVEKAKISIHAPAKGATLKGAGFESDYYIFQSTHPRRVRQSIYLGTFDTLEISIHAPAKGATINLLGDI